MGEVTEERNPYSGQMMFRRVDVRKPERMIEEGTFKATVTERVPTAYFIPSNLRNVIDRLQAHGIATTTLQASQTIPVEEFRLEGIEPAAQPFQNRTERTLRGAWASRRSRASGRHHSRRPHAAAWQARVLPHRATVGRWAGQLESG